MARRRKNRIDEGKFSKGQLRKLNALRKSLGDDIGSRAFAEWLAVGSDSVTEQSRLEAMQRWSSSAASNRSGAVSTKPSSTGGRALKSVQPSYVKLSAAKKAAIRDAVRETIKEHAGKR